MILITEYLSIFTIVDIFKSIVWILKKIMQKDLKFVVELEYLFIFAKGNACFWKLSIYGKSYLEIIGTLKKRQ